MPASITIEMTARQFALLQAMDKWAQSQAKIKGGYKGVENAAARAGRKGRTAGQNLGGAFGKQALSQLLAYAGGFLSMTAAIGQVTRALNEMAAAREQAAQAQEQAYVDIGSLSQLATTEEKMQKLLDVTNQLYGMGVGTNRAEAGKLTFSLESAGILDQYKLFGELAGKAVLSQADEFVKAIGALRSSMGEEETGTVRDMLNKAFGASGESPSRAPEIMIGAAKAGVSAKQLGISDEELFAAEALMATSKAGAEEGATYLNQMLRSLGSKEGLKGKSLKDIILTVQQQMQGTEGGFEMFAETPEEGKRMAEEYSAWVTERKQQIATDFQRKKGRGMNEKERRKAFQEFSPEGMSEAERQKFFGRAQGYQAFVVMADQMAQYEKNLVEVQQGVLTDRVSKQLKLATMDPRQRSVYEARTAKSGEELGRDQLGILHNLAEATMNNYAAAVRRGEVKTVLPTELSIAFRRRGEGLLRWFKGDETWLKGRLAEVPELRQFAPEDVKQRFPLQRPFSGEPTPGWKAAGEVIQEGIAKPWRLADPVGLVQEFYDRQRTENQRVTQDQARAAQSLQEAAGKLDVAASKLGGAAPAGNPIKPLGAGPKIGR